MDFTSNPPSSSSYAIIAAITRCSAHGGGEGKGLLARPFVYFRVKYDRIKTWKKNKKMLAEKKLRKKFLKTIKHFRNDFFPRPRGKFALLKDGNLIEIMNNKTDAHKMGTRLFDDGLYSIQEIFPKKSDLGFMSYALR